MDLKGTDLWDLKGSKGKSKVPKGFQEVRKDLRGPRGTHSRGPNGYH